MAHFVNRQTQAGCREARNILVAAALAIGLVNSLHADAASRLDYRILATSKTSTMEKELNEAAAAGYRFRKVMGGRTAEGGQEVAIAMVKAADAPELPGPAYKLLATTKTSTMQKELQTLADDGYEYLDQTIFESAFGGHEVVVIMERDALGNHPRSKYKLLATTRTSTMEKELKDAGDQGYLLVGFTIGKTALGGDEIVSILKKDQAAIAKK